jgi:hypothetical protein
MAEEGGNFRSAAVELRTAPVEAFMFDLASGGGESTEGTDSPEVATFCGGPGLPVTAEVVGSCLTTSTGAVAA